MRLKYNLSSRHIIIVSLRTQYKMPFCLHQLHSCIPLVTSYFLSQNVERFSFFQLVFRPRKRRVSLSASHDVAEKLSDRQQLHTSSCFNSDQPDCSPPYHPVEFAGHLCRGNKTPTAKQLQHASGRFSEHRFIHWAGCLTCTHRGGTEANPWCRTIL